MILSKTILPFLGALLVQAQYHDNDHYERLLALRSLLDVDEYNYHPSSLYERDIFQDDSVLQERDYANPYLYIQANDEKEIPEYEKKGFNPDFETSLYDKTKWLDLKLKSAYFIYQYWLKHPDQIGADVKLPKWRHQFNHHKIEMQNGYKFLKKYGEDE